MNLKGTGNKTEATINEGRAETNKTDLLAADEANKFSYILIYFRLKLKERKEKIFDRSGFSGEGVVEPVWLSGKELEW